MADQIGRIPVPFPVKSNTTFKLVSEYGYGMTRDWRVVEHRFGAPYTMGIQRYGLGSGARRFQFVKSSLTYKDRQALLDFYDNTQGSYQSFTYPVPNSDRSTFTNYEVVFETAPLSITELTNRAQMGLVFLEIIDPANAPSGTVNGPPQVRFPSDTLAQALASEVQELIPLVHIRVRNASVPDIYLSDRRVNISGFPGAPSPTTFLPRMLGVGVPGASDVIMSQSIDGRSDNVRFTFGNADRTMTKLINDCSLEYAEIDLSFFHVGTSILLQLWKGLIMSWQVDGSAQMSVQCSDGLYPITQAYPPRTVSRQCWKPFNQDVVPGYRPCPWSTQGGGTGNASSCDYFFNSANGCLSHKMSQYFGGHPEQPQTVVIKDDGTGIFGGFFRSTVTSTSILSDSIWGNPLQEIWCNYLGTAQRAFWANCLVAAVREESQFEDVLGIVGAGPIGQFEGMSVQTNADGYKFVVAPTADGFFPQGFQLDGSLAITGYFPNYGLRQSVGNDPAHLGTAPTDGIDAFSLGQGTPQQWSIPDPAFSNDGIAKSIIPYAAGTALCEIRYPKSAGKGISPTTAESHSMQCPIRLGLTGSVFDAGGARTLVPGLVNPFWIGANSYFRALGISQASAATQLQYLVLNSITNSGGTGCADIAALWVDPVVGTAVLGYSVTATGQALLHYNLDLFNDTFTYQDSGGAIHTMTLNQAQAAGYIEPYGPSGKEPQFMFQGTVAEFKPFRDWLTEILNCALGYFCFEFGALKMGIRYSAVPTDSFNLSSMLYQSMTITPISAGFEYLKVSFANVELQYQQDLAEYQDKDHAAYYGRAGAPLTSSMKSVGCSTLSQGLRIAVTRTREEIGGILRGVAYGGVADTTTNPYVEWDNNKRVTFKSTLLALNNEVGQVIGIQHPDLPTYPGAHPASRSGSNGPFAANTWPFRIKKWMLHSDFSVSIMADSCVDSMYDLDVGPQPQGVGPRPLPIAFYPEPLGQWAPHQVQAAPGDALFPNEWTFNLQQTFKYEGDGRLLTSAVVAGLLPVNQFVPNCGAPDVKKGGVTWSPTGGSIPGGTTLFAQVCAAIVDTSVTPNIVKQYSPPSQILVLQVPVGTNTNSVTLNNIKWPPVAALNGYVLFANPIEDLICGQQAGLGQPATITFNGPVARQTYAVPDYDLNILRLRAQVLIHGGVLGGGVDSVTTSTIVSGATGDPSGHDDWSNRVLAIIGRQQGDGIGPFAHFNITHFNAATGTYTLDRDPTVATSTVDAVRPGDIFVVCFLGADNSANPYVIGDPGISNAGNPGGPHTGETVNDPNRIGRMVRVIKGTSRGQQAKIVSNTATAYTLDRALPIDATSVWVVCDPGWNYSKDVVVDNADPSRTTLSAIEINNYKGLALLVEGVTIDNEGGIIDDADACIRMLYIPGVQGTTTMAT
jgi:hypothetical protein